MGLRMCCHSQRGGVVLVLKTMSRCCDMVLSFRNEMILVVPPLVNESLNQSDGCTMIGNLFVKDQIVNTYSDSPVFQLKSLKRAILITHTFRVGRNFKCSLSSYLQV